MLLLCTIVLVFVYICGLIIHTHTHTTHTHCNYIFYESIICAIIFSFALYTYYFCVLFWYILVQIILTVFALYTCLYYLYIIESCMFVHQII